MGKTGQEAWDGGSNDREAAMGQETWAIGVDLGGTKIEVASVDAGGKR